MLLHSENNSQPHGNRRGNGQGIQTPALLFTTLFFPQLIPLLHCHWASPKLLGNWEQIMLMQSIIKFWLCIYTSVRDRLEGHGLSPAWAELLRDPWFKNPFQIFMARVLCCNLQHFRRGDTGQEKGSKRLHWTPQVCSAQKRWEQEVSPSWDLQFSQLQNSTMVSLPDSGHNPMLVRLKDWSAVVTG